MPTVISGTTGVSQVQDGVVDADALATLAKPVGVGQTWQNVTASRAINTTYTNTTGRPIMVSVKAQGGASAYISLYVDGLHVSHNGNTATSGMKADAQAIVPSGSTYSASDLTGTLSWFELR